MAIVQQQLRSGSSGSVPGDLEPGQLAYNLNDAVGFLGNGGNTKTLKDGSIATPAPTAGKGWIEFALKADDISQLIAGDFIPNPSTLASPPPDPTDGQVLTWDPTADAGSGAYIPKDPTGGGATVLGDLDNVSTPPTTVLGSNQGGFFVRDISVASEGATGAYKISTLIDSGTY